MRSSRAMLSHAMDRTEPLVSDAARVDPDKDRWRMLGWISLAELGALSLWFSATAVIPALSAPWLDDAAKAWLSMAVTLGFVVGTAVSTVLTLADWLGA